MDEKMNIKKRECANLLANKMKTNEKTAEIRIHAFTDTLYECFKQGRGTVITNLGTFYQRITSRSDSIFRSRPT